MCAGFYKFVALDQYQHTEPITISTSGKDIFAHYTIKEFSSNQMFIKSHMGSRNGRSDKLAGPKSFAFSFICSGTQIKHIEVRNIGNNDIKLKKREKKTHQLEHESNDPSLVQYGNKRAGQK